jgi:signal transduction histidine kinase
MSDQQSSEDFRVEMGGFFLEHDLAVLPSKGGSMEASDVRSREERGSAAEPGWLEPGVLVIRPGGELGFADEPALRLLGQTDQGGLEARWSALRSDLEEAGFRWEAGARTQAAVTGPGGRALAFDFRPDPAGGGVLLLRDRPAATGAESDLRQVALMRSLTQITPAVAHDLRAPINAMVFNIEVLKETVASGRAAEAAGKERVLRYVNVLKEELHRLHHGMETFIAQISPRGDRDESMDLREPLEELAALLIGPARKQQVRVTTDLPTGKVMVFGNRYLLRQALLHISLAALGTVPRDGILEIGLEASPESGLGTRPTGDGRSGRARIRIEGNSGNVAGAGPDPAPGFDVRVSEKGTQAQLWVARSILASQGGEVRPVLVEGEPRAYEVDLTLQDTVSQEKE